LGLMVELLRPLTIATWLASKLYPIDPAIATE
jgi:hypothetical protein